MFVYLFLIVLSFLFALISLDFRLIKSKRLLFFLSNFLCLLLVIIASIRNNTGYDFEIYRDTFNNAPSLLGIFSKRVFLHSEFEPGYTFFIALVKTIFNSFHFQLLVFSIVNIFFLQRIIFKNSPYPLISLFLYICFFYFFMLMGQMRQGLAIIILYYSYDHILERNFKKFIIILLVAASFHISALIFLPAYFFANKKYKRSRILIIFIAVFIFNVFLIDQIILFIETLYLANPSNGTLFKIYIYSQHYVGDFSLMAYYEKIVLAIIIILLYNNKSIIKSVPDFQVISNIMLIGIIIYMSLIQTFTVIGARGANNFLSFSIFIYPMFLKATKDLSLKSFYFLIIVSYPLIRCLLKLFTETDYIPYKTFFN